MSPKYLSSKRLVSGTLFFVVANGMIFFIYRVVLDWTVTGVSGSANPYPTLVYGLRLDVALAAFELAVAGFIAWCFRFVSVRLLALVLWGLTSVHALVCVSNYWFFRERGQHMWEMLLANLSEPRQIYLAVAPLFVEQQSLAGLMLVCAVGFLWLGIRLSRRTAGCIVDFSGTRKIRLINLLCILAVFACTLDPVRIKRNDWPLGWYVGLTSSRSYLGDGGYLRNQVVINPVYDFLTFHLPVALQQESTFLLTRERALEIVRTLLEIPAGDGKYPLLRSVTSEAKVAIKNVVIIQVEGLGEVLVRHEQEGKVVMPYLSGLVQSSIYFPNFFQSFNSTDGAVFSAVSGFPETFVERNRKDFLAYDVGGHYPSLSRVLGDDDYDHYFFQGFRHRAADYVSFMKNQGYRTYGIDYFENLARTKDIDADSVNALGVYDGVLLEEAARIISRKSSKGFTAHIVTATTHSPWTYLKPFSPVFANNRMNVFHYVDRALEAFVKKLREELSDFDQTLFVITGDHTSAAVEDDDAERIRVPLILVNAQLTRLRRQFEEQSKTLGSHMDIVPTILGLLGRPYCYSGMGMDLLSRKSVNKGAITSNRRESYYLQGFFILTYAPNRNTSELRSFDQKRINHGDISQKYPEVFDRMKLEYLAFYETSKRLTREKATFPGATPRPPCRSVSKR